MVALNVCAWNDERHKIPPTDWRSRYFNPENLANTMERADKRKQILPGMSVPARALCFVLSHPASTPGVVGMRKSQPIRENTALSDLGALPNLFRMS
jgi:aryl-alcohol dehydrogenase-like predicted oxidoreductase